MTTLPTEATVGSKESNSMFVDIYSTSPTLYVSDNNLCSPCQSLKREFEHSVNVVCTFHYNISGVILPPHYPSAIEVVGLSSIVQHNKDTRTLTVLM